MQHTQPSNMKKHFLTVMALFLSCALFAGPGDSTVSKAESDKMLLILDSLSKLKYETGVIKLSGGAVDLNVPEGFRFLNAKDSRFILTDLWGNPPDLKVLGMIFPENGGPLADSSYAFVITYDAIGYVKDEDADKIDYDKMLKELQEDEKKENEERKKLGYEPIHMVRWAAKPYYDKTNKVLHWAKELQFGNNEYQTLNYDIRILGRKGILSLNAVATTSELELVKRDIPKVLTMAQFTSGNAYKDFDSNVDEVAAWTIGGLVAGKVLAKVGLLAFFGKFLKIILIGAGALGVGIYKFFKRKKQQQEELVYQPATPAEPPADNDQKTV